MAETRQGTVPPPKSTDSYTDRHAPATRKPHRRAGDQRRVIGRDGHQRHSYDFAALMKAMG